MKKFLVLLSVFSFSFALSGCEGKETIVEVEKELPAIPDVVDMENIDDYLGRPDVQYVDLRNFDDKMSAGYIAGFEIIPFFDYLEAMDVLVRTDGDFIFAAEDIVSQAGLFGLFDEDKTIFLMCGSGTRAGYVKDALESLGYTDVYNVGGIGTYAGDNMVLGDGTYNVEVQLPLPAEITMDTIDQYLGRSDVQYVDLRDFDDKMKSGYIAGFEMIPFFDYLEFSDILVRTDGDFVFAEEDIQSIAGLFGLFNEDKAIFLMCGSGTRAGYVKDALESLGYTHVYNIGGIGNYTGDNLVLGDGTYTNVPVQTGPFTPGTYYGYEDGYLAIVTVGAGGKIIDVFVDSAHFSYGTTELLSMKRDYTDPSQYDLNYTVDDNNTPEDPSDDIYTLDEGKLDWWMQADAVEAAVLEAQGVDSSWTFDVDGKFAADEIAGVSITVEPWMVAIQEAIDAATPE